MSAVKTLGTIGLGGATLLGSVTNAHAQKKETKPNQGETVEEVRLSAEQVKSLKPDLKDLTKSLTAKTNYEILLYIYEIILFKFYKRL